MRLKIIPFSFLVCAATGMLGVDEANAIGTLDRKKEI